MDWACHGLRCDIVCKFQLDLRRAESGLNLGCDLVGVGDSYLPFDLSRSNGDTYRKRFGAVAAPDL